MKRTTPKMLRLLKALISTERGLSAKELSSVAGVSRAANFLGGEGFIAQKFGVSVYAEIVEGIDRDGKKIKYGLYKLDDAGRETVERMLGGAL